MSDFSIVIESPTSMTRKLIRVYFENDGAYRQIDRTVNIDVDVEQYITDNFAMVWASASDLPESEWIAASEADADTLYRDVARAAIQAGRGAGSLNDITQAMDDTISVSGKANAYARLKTLASGATAVQRDAFFLAIAFVVLGKESAG